MEIQDTSLINLSLILWAVDIMIEAKFKSDSEINIEIRFYSQIFLTDERGGDQTLLFDHWRISWETMNKSLLIFSVCVGTIVVSFSPWGYCSWFSYLAIARCLREFQKKSWMAMNFHWVTLQTATDCQIHCEINLITAVLSPFNG